METVIIKLDSKKLKNPDLDIIYILPEKIEKVSNGRLCDNGYEYLSNTEIGMWLSSENAENDWKIIVQIIKKEQFCNNDLSASAQIYISKKECAEIGECEKVYSN